MRPFQPVTRISTFSRSFNAWSARENRHLLLTFDAFGTLFKPKLPIATQYALVAQEHGLTDVKEADVQVAFKRAYKQESVENPNFGKRTGMTPSEWWTKIITNTFTSITSSSLPPSLAPALIHRFSSKEAYTLYPEVIPLLRSIRSQPSEWPYTTTTIGVITNSDSRVTSILNDLGVGVREYQSTIPGQSYPKEEGVGDMALIDFVTFSYDVGSEKPGHKIFDAARRHWVDHLDTSGMILTTHVGDDHVKDFRGAMKAGWSAILVDREGKRRQWKDNGQGIVGTLDEVMDILYHDPEKRSNKLYYYRLGC